MLIPKTFLGGKILFPRKVWKSEILPNERFRLKLVDSLVVGRMWSIQAAQLADL